MRRISLSIIAVFLGAVATKVHSNPYEDLSVVNPFILPQAVNRLYEAVPETPAELRNFLPLIQKIEYSFDQAGDCPFVSPTICSNPTKEKPYFRATRTITIRLPDIDGVVSQALIAASYDGCSWMQVKNPRLLLSTGNALRYIADVEGKKRACGNYPWPFSGEWKTDIASASGNVQVSVNLIARGSSTNAESDFGDFKFDVPAPSVNISSSEVIGIDANSIIGKLIAFLLEGIKFVVDVGTFKVIDLGLEKTLEYLKGAAPAVNYAYSEGKAEQVIRSVPDFYAKVEQMNLTKLYFLDDTKTRFGPVIDGWRTLEIVQFAVVPGSLMPIYYYSKEQEVGFFADLGQEPEDYSVKKGDGLWKLSEKRYGVGDAWFAIAHHNNLLSARLSVGQEIVFPRLWQIAAYEKQMVKPGDSLYTLSTRLGTPLAKPFGSRSSNKIYPYQVVIPKE